MEQGAQCMGQRAWSREHGAWGKGQGAKGKEHGARSKEHGALERLNVARWNVFALER